MVLLRHLGRIGECGWKASNRLRLNCPSIAGGSSWRSAPPGSLYPSAQGRSLPRVWHQWRFLSSGPPDSSGRHEEGVGEMGGSNSKRSALKIEMQGAKETEQGSQFRGSNLKKEEKDLDKEENNASWEYDAPSEYTFVDREDTPPSPILDEYERTRDPQMLEDLMKMARDSLPPRAGPRRNNHKRREHQRFRAIRNIKYKEKEQRQAAYARKLLKRKERKARDFAMFAEWRQGSEDQQDTT